MTRRAAPRWIFKEKVMLIKKLEDGSVNMELSERELMLVSYAVCFTINENECTLKDEVDLRALLPGMRDALELDLGHEEE